MSDDIFNQISKIIAKKGVSGVSKDAAEWSVLLSEMPKIAANTQAQFEKTPDTDAVSETFIKPRTRENAVQEHPVSAAPTQQHTTQHINTQNLDELRNLVVKCCNCQLANTRNSVVFGEGNPNAELMFIGEAPGADEDLSGRPFVGKAGQLLDKMITAMQFSRSEVYIANILKCRPPFNRNPEPSEAACCIQYLEEQIRLVNPKCIVLLGAVATRFLLKHDGPVSKIRGTWSSYNNIPVMITYHPSYLLRTESAKRDCWNDLQKVMAKFGKFHKRS